MYINNFTGKRFALPDKVCRAPDLCPMKYAEKGRSRNPPEQLDRSARCIF